MDGADDGDRADELAKKTAQLNEQQRQQYQRSVDLKTEAYGRVTDQYRLDVVKTLLQPIPQKEQALQIKRADEREYQRAFDHNQREERLRAAPPPPAKQLASEQSASVQDSGKQQPKLDPMAGVRLHSAPRDYNELHKTHEKVAAAEPATALIPKERLESMAERYAEVRKAGNIQPTPVDVRKINEQDRMQTESRAKLDRAHGPAPNAQQKQERALLDHQHLAERVGDQARMIGQHLRRQSMPGAESYEREARSAYHTARQVHEQRQNLGMGTDRAKDAARIAQQQEQQKQSNLQEAARGGKTLTSEQMANASPEARQTLERKDRAEVARAIGAEIKGQSAQQGITKQGNARSGGRGR